MFKIDKSSVEYIDSNKDIVVIKHMLLNDRDTSSDVDSKDEEGSEDLETLTFVNERARRLIEQAKNESEMIISSALMESQNIKSNAWQEGFVKGKQEALQKQEEQTQLLLEQLRQGLYELEIYKKGMEKELEENILQLSLDIAEKIINIQLEKDDIVFVGMVKKAIAHLNTSEKFILHLNPKQVESFLSKSADWLDKELSAESFTIVKDPGIDKNGCILESKTGIVNAGISSQIKKMSAILNSGQNDQLEYDEAL